MTLQNRTDVYAPTTLTDEQRRRVADALENAQSENTRKNCASQFHKFRAWCVREDQSPLPASPEVIAAHTAELAYDGKSHGPAIGGGHGDRAHTENNARWLT